MIAAMIAAPMASEGLPADGTAVVDVRTPREDGQQARPSGTWQDVSCGALREAASSWQKLIVLFVAAER